MKQRMNFSEIELEVIRRSVAMNIMPSDIAQSLCIEGRIYRSHDSIVRQIWKMGLVYSGNPEIKLQHGPKSKKEREKSPGKKSYPPNVCKIVNKDERRRLLSFHPNYTEFWQSALFFTKAKIQEHAGNKYYAINGIPVTTFEIMNRYKEALKNGSIQTFRR